MLLKIALFFCVVILNILAAFYVGLIYISNDVFMMIISVMCVSVSILIQVWIFSQKTKKDLNQPLYFYGPRGIELNVKEYLRREKRP